MASPSFGELVMLQRLTQGGGRSPAGIRNPIMTRYGPTVPLESEERGTTIKEPQAIPEEVWQELLAKQPGFPGVQDSKASQVALGDLYEGMRDMPMEVDLSPTAGLIKGLYGKDFGYKAPEDPMVRLTNLAGLQKLIGETGGDETANALAIVKNAMQERTMSATSGTKENMPNPPPAPRVPPAGKDTTNTDIDKYIEGLDKSDVPALLSGFKVLEAALPEAGKDIPDFGGARGMLSKAFPDAMKASTRQAFASFKNQVSKMRAGATQTNAELERIDQELGSGWFTSGDQFREAMGRISKAVQADIANQAVRLAKNPELTQEYARRAKAAGGQPILPTDPVFSSPKFTVKAPKKGGLTAEEAAELEALEKEFGK